MTLQAYLTADMQASLDDAPMMAVTSYGVNWIIDTCPHCDGVGVLGYRWGAEGVIEDVCSACKGRGRMPDADDVDGIPF